MRGLSQAVGFSGLRIEFRPRFAENWKSYHLSSRFLSRRILSVRKRQKYFIGNRGTDSHTHTHTCTRARTLTPYQTKSSPGCRRTVIFSLAFSRFRDVMASPRIDLVSCCGTALAVHLTPLLSAWICTLRGLAAYILHRWWDVKALPIKQEENSRGGNAIYSYMRCSF